MLFGAIRSVLHRSMCRRVWCRCTTVLSCQCARYTSSLTMQRHPSMHGAMRSHMSICVIIAYARGHAVPCTAPCTAISECMALPLCSGTHDLCGTLYPFSETSRVYPGRWEHLQHLAVTGARCGSGAASASYWACCWACGLRMRTPLCLRTT